MLALSCRDDLSASTVQLLSRNHEGRTGDDGYRVDGKSAFGLPPQTLAASGVYKCLMMKASITPV